MQTAPAILSPPEIAAFLTASSSDSGKPLPKMMSPSCKAFHRQMFLTQDGESNSEPPAKAKNALKIELKASTDCPQEKGFADESEFMSQFGNASIWGSFDQNSSFFSTMVREQDEACDKPLPIQSETTIV